MELKINPEKIENWNRELLDLEAQVGHILETILKVLGQIHEVDTLEIHILIHEIRNSINDIERMRSLMHELSYILAKTRDSYLACDSCLSVSFFDNFEDSSVLSEKTSPPSSAHAAERRQSADVPTPPVPDTPSASLTYVPPFPMASPPSPQQMSETTTTAPSIPMPMPVPPDKSTLGGLFGGGDIFRRKRDKVKRDVSHSKGPFGPSPDSSVVAPVPTVELNKVEFSAVAPKTFIKGEYNIVKIIMYEEAFRNIVEEAKTSDHQEARSGVFKVAERSSVRIVLSSPDIDIDDNEEEREWQGDYLFFDFAVLLPEQYSKRQILFNATIYVNGVIASKLKFYTKCSSLFEQKIEMTRQDILSAFISYASQDRNRVVMMIQGMKKARPDMDLFFDVDSLRSGDDWEHALRCEIEKRDILYLCWSQFARASKWVDTEWRYALDCKGIDCIEPVPIEPPSICPPPEELKQKHFNDKLLYYINSATQENNQHELQPNK